MTYRPKDAYHRRARAAGYRARSAYKLAELAARFRLLRRGDYVIDLGAWPGGWLQIASDGRFLWLHDAGAQHPIAFSSQGDERAYQLVFTRIADGNAAGYILVPVTPVTTQTATK